MSQELKYPLPWLESNFKSPDRIHELLQPELENGNLTQHDFESAKKFYPRRHRYYPIFYASVGALQALYQARAHSWRPRSLVAIASFASCFGYLAGKAHNLKIHTEFVKTLEDPQGFSTALQNVNQRFGGTANWTYVISLKADRPVIDVIKQSPSPTKEDHELSEQQDETMNWDVSPAPTPPSNIPAKSAPQSTVASPPLGRWDQIRAANKNGGPISSWDRIRQNHEQSRIQTTQEDSQDSQTQESTFEIREDPTRALDEARFEAMLEVENRRTSRG